MPRAVASLGRMRGKVVEFVQSQFQFDDSELVVSAVGGVIRQQGRAFTHAFEIQLERATLMYDFAVIGGEGQNLLPLTVLDAKGKVQRPQDLPLKRSAGCGFVAELRETALARFAPASLRRSSAANWPATRCVPCQKQLPRRSPAAGSKGIYRIAGNSSSRRIGKSVELWLFR